MTPSATIQPSSSRAWWIAVGIMAVLWILSVPTTWQVEGVDEIEYLSLAHSLTLGLGYTMYGEPHVYYPPVYPTLLGAALRLLPHESWRCFYALNAGLALAALAGFGAWMRHRLGTAGRWAAWLSLFSYYGWSFSTRFLLSEQVYLLLSLSALVLAYEAIHRPVWARWMWAMLFLCCLGSAATRSASIALAAGLGLTACAVWVQKHRRRAVALVLCGVLPMLAFNAAWQVRADRVNPQAAESYLRWAKRFLGAQGDAKSGSVVDRNAGEGIRAEDNRWSNRSLLLMDKTGQTLLSVPRIGTSFRPVAVFLSLLLLAGLLAEARRNPGSPLPWFVLVSLLMFSLTSWVSSYLRYLYTLLPILFVFTLKGARCLALEKYRTVAGTFLGIMGLWAVESGFRDLLHFPAPLGMEGYYQFALSLLVLLAGVVWVVLSYVWFRRKFREDPLPPGTRAMAVVLALVLGHGALLAAQRVRLARHNTSLVEKQLLPAFNAARIAARHLPPTARGVSGYPLLLRYVMNRELVRPADCTNPLQPDVDFVVSVGIISYVPGVDWSVEECLRQRVARAVSEGQMIPLSQAGRAGVYLPASTGGN